MSRSKPLPAITQNPSRRYIGVRAARTQGYFDTYVKFAEPKTVEGKQVKGENVKVDFSKGKGFALLDDNVFTITGWNDTQKYNIISNEVRANDPDTGESLFADRRSTLTVWKYPQNGQKQKWITGVYNDIKSTVTGREEGSFTGCLYIMAEDGVQDHLKLHGAAFSAWVEFKDKYKDQIYQHWIKVEEEWLEKKKGSTEYKVPVFKLGDKLSESESEKATELDARVQEFLKGYMARGGKAEDDNENSSSSANEGAASNNKEVQKNWRKFKEEGKAVLGSLSIQELIRLQGDLEAQGGPVLESVLYDCVSQAVFDYEQMLKTGSWKEGKTSSGKSFGELSLAELREGLALFNKHNPSHDLKLSVEAGIETREAEAGPINEPDESGKSPF